VLIAGRTAGTALLREAGGGTAARAGLPDWKTWSWVLLMAFSCRAEGPPALTLVMIYKKT